MSVLHSGVTADWRGGGGKKYLKINCVHPHCSLDLVQPVGILACQQTHTLYKTHQQTHTQYKTHQTTGPCTVQDTPNNRPTHTVQDTPTDKPTQTVQVTPTGTHTHTHTHTLYKTHQPTDLHTLYKTPQQTHTLYKTHQPILLLNIKI